MINRISIVVAFTIYTLAGREIYRNREQLSAFNRRPGYPMEIGNPFDSYKTTEVNITSETVPITGRGLVSTTANENGPSRTPSGRGYDPYTVTIGCAPPSSRTRRPLTPSGETLTYRKNKAAMEANTAAWGYTKCALLFFVSLLITWVPSSINRVYSLVHPDLISVPFTYASGVVLPLMGFWNSVIYITTSWTPCKMLFRGIFCNSSHQPSTALRRRSSNSVEQTSRSGTKTSDESISESVKGLACSDAV
ncbi:hypothetical protein MMC29_000308 [Sticta canariensis]|nr:hypothetical protein [Sticta canariensis]